MKKTKRKIESVPNAPFFHFYPIFSPLGRFEYRLPYYSAIPSRRKKKKKKRKREELKMGGEKKIEILLVFSFPFMQYFLL